MAQLKLITFAGTGTGSPVTVYTCPADKEFVASTIVIVNTNTSPYTGVTFGVYDATTGVVYSIVHNETIKGGATIRMTEGLVLEAGDYWQITDTSSGLEVVINGELKDVL